MTFPTPEELARFLVRVAGMPANGGGRAGMQAREAIVQHAKDLLRRIDGQYELPREEGGR